SFFGWTFNGNTTLNDLEDASRRVHWNLGGAVTFTRGLLGVEGYFVFTPHFFNHAADTPLPANFRVRDSPMDAGMGNPGLTAPKKWTEYALRPFVSGGFGALHASQTCCEAPAEILSYSRTTAGYNIGGGVVGNLSKRTGLRFDLRYIGNLRDVTEADPLVAPTTGRLHLRFWTAAIGVVIRY